MMINSTVTIGITGNIATGKSVIRRMLSNSGVFGIDADAIANRMLYPGGYAYQSVLEAFGSEIITDHKHISNKKLGQIVFNDPARLIQLESLVHPPVIKSIEQRVKAAKPPIVAIEAIKLLESGLGDRCDHIWVSHVSYEQQKQRLQTIRGLTEKDADSRIKAQTPQIGKLSQADVIINTEATFKDTWRRTQRALNDTIQPTINGTLLHINNSEDCTAGSINLLPVDQLETAWNKLSNEDLSTLYEYLGMQMIFPVLKNGQIMAFVIYEDWNFSATLKKVYPSGILESMPDFIFDAFEKSAKSNQAEILLISEDLFKIAGKNIQQFGFTPQHINKITYPAWKIAAEKSAPGEGSEIYNKVLRQPFEQEDTTFLQ